MDEKQPLILGQEGDMNTFGLEDDVRSDFSVLDQNAQFYAIALHKQWDANPIDVFNIMDSVRDPQRAFEQIIVLHTQNQVYAIGFSIDDAIETYRAQLTPDMIKTHYQSDSEEALPPVNETDFAPSDMVEISGVARDMYPELLDLSTPENIRRTAIRLDFSDSRLEDYLEIGDRAIVAQHLEQTGMSYDLVMKAARELCNDSFEILYTTTTVMLTQSNITSQKLDELAAHLITKEPVLYGNEIVN